MNGDFEFDSFFYFDEVYFIDVMLLLFQPRKKRTASSFSRNIGWNRIMGVRVHEGF